ncbi:DsbA family oxidoreductase [Alteraurantiacibacter aestuarii]|uniref:Thioredoxin domain-containing protein n=1 Tax=Alteraurantiacibacter aestuarii TaxID=650004 RepID=A0A844ZKU4_9SPHN|nr:DsbA family oxidoreductase [Alteraurantiacibacter aestuarii]MXO87892.1 thioredoxin domain-containing protein [Alteraurantiacibacter aestuarii]
MSDKLTVDIWSDVVCPWCAIGCTQFEQAVADLAGDVDVEMRFMPFELNPQMGPEGHNQVDLLAKAYGKTPADVLQMRRNVEATGAEAGFPMAYSGEGEEPVLMVWNTHQAHMLLRWALTVANADAQVRLKKAMFRAYFQQRRNISDREVLLDIAAAEGFDREAAAAALDDEALSAAVKMEEQRGLQNQITSVPTFVVNGKYILQGAAPPDDYKQALYKLASMEAMS